MATMELEAAIPVADSLLFGISVAGFVILATTMYWAFFRQSGGDDEARHHQLPRNNHPRSSVQDRKRKHKRRPASTSSIRSHNSEQAVAAAKREKLGMKQLEKQKEQLDAYHRFLGPVSVEDLATRRVLHLGEVAETCGESSCENVRQRINELVLTKRWAGLFVPAPAESSSTESLLPPSLFVRLSDEELEEIAETIRERGRVSTHEIAEITKLVVSRNQNQIAS